MKWFNKEKDKSYLWQNGKPCKNCVSLTFFKIPKGMTVKIFKKTKMYKDALCWNCHCKVSGEE